MTPNDADFGPEDARAISDPWKNPILVFNMRDAKDKIMWSFNVTSGELVKLRAADAFKFEKNWSPLFDTMNHLVYLRSWNPISTVACSHLGKCVSHNKVNSTISLLRTGSAFYSYRGGYQVATVRTNIKHLPVSKYSPRLVILDKELRVIYMSENLFFNFDGLFKTKGYNRSTIDFQPVSKTRFPILTSQGCVPMFDPTDEKRESKDWVIEFSVLDTRNVYVVFKNLGLLIDHVIESYEELTKNKNNNLNSIPDLQKWVVEQALNSKD